MAEEGYEPTTVLGWIVELRPPGVFITIDHVPTTHTFMITAMRGKTRVHYALESVHAENALAARAYAGLIWQKIMDGFDPIPVVA